MKKTFVLCVCALLLASAFVQVRLTAQQPNEKTNNNVSEAAAPADKAVISRKVPAKPAVTPAHTMEWNKNTWSRNRVSSVREIIGERLRTSYDFTLTEKSTYSDLLKMFHTHAQISFFWDTKYIKETGDGKTTINSTIVNVEPAEYRGMPLGRALELILGANDLAYIVDEGFLLITSEERAEDIKAERAEKAAAKPAASQSIVPLANDPDYIQLLRQRVDTAKFRFEDLYAKAKLGTGTQLAAEEAKLALAEAKYALKQAEKAGKRNPALYRKRLPTASH
jgi:hypothetical protein